MGILRFLLATSVVIAHSNPLFGFKLMPGWNAVEVFFIISGFYMTMILDRKYIGEGRLFLFWSNRFLRLYPIYWFVMLMVILASLAQYFLLNDWDRLESYIEYADILSFGTWFYLIISNFTMLGQDIILFLSLNPDNGEMFWTSNFMQTDPRMHGFLFIPQAWSLSIEIMFYLIAPFVVTKSLKVIAPLFALSLAVGLYTYHMGLDHDPWTYRFFLSELALFLLGTFAYRLYKKGLEKSVFTPKKLYAVCAVYLAILVFYNYLPVHEWAFYLFTCAALPFVFELTKSAKLDSKIGELSYPIYISHLFVISILSPVLSRLSLQDYTGEFGVIGSIIFSYLLVIFVSNPIEKIRQARIERASVPPKNDL